MRQSKKAERSINELARRLAELGLDSTAVESIKDNAPETRDAISRQGDAVLTWLEAPAKFTMKLCKRCKEPFGTNYRSVAYCSDNCRARDISEQIGVKWDWTARTEEQRWGGEPPLIIPPLALRRLLQYCRYFVDILPTLPQAENLPETTVHFLDQATRLQECMKEVEELLANIDSDA